MDEPAYLTTREVAALLRLRERKVYALAASGALPCVKPTGKLLFPREAVEAIVKGASLGGAVAEAPLPIPADVVAGSHDPLLDWAVRQAGSGLGTLVEGSGNGLSRMLRGGAVAAGMHLAERGGYNTRQVDEAWANGPKLRPLVLVEWARRRAGLMLRAGAGIGRLADLAGRTVAGRQKGSGAAALLERLAAAPDWPSQVRVLDRVARNETEAALAVARGEADAAPGIEAMARQHGLEFLALETERFDLLVDRLAYFEPPMQALWAIARSPAFGAEAEALGGYDISGHGTVHWNAPD